MTNLILAICAFVPISGPSAELSLAADLPLNAPSGWTSRKQEGSLILTPPNVASGKTFVVTASGTDAKSLSIDDLLDAGKKMVAEIGEYKVATDPKQFTSSGDWICKFVLGGVEKGDHSLVIQVTAVKKDDRGGVIIALADSVETMTKYADDFSGMLRSLGGAKATASPLASSGKVDLQYTVPDGWTASKVNGFPLLVKEKHSDYDNWRVSLLILPTEAQSGSIRQQFASYWKSLITPNYDVTIAPMPLLMRMKSGQACALDGEFMPNNKSGITTAVLYMLIHGGRVTPIMGIYTGAEWAIDGKIETEVSKFMDSARIPGTTDAKAKLFSADEVAGNWKESGAEFANYVTSTGSFVRSETIATAAYFDINSDGSYERTLLSVGSLGNGKEKDSGTWSIDDDELVLKTGGRYSLFGCANDPKVGRFLVIGNNRNQKTRLKFTNPRGPLQAMWLHAKQ